MCVCVSLEIGVVVDIPLSGSTNSWPANTLLAENVKHFSQVISPIVWVCPKMMISLKMRRFLYPNDHFGWFAPLIRLELAVPQDYHRQCSSLK